MAYTNRKDIPEKYKWNLGDIFATPADWEKTFEKLSAEYPTLASYKGKLADRNNLLEFLKRSDSFDVELGKLYCYAYMSYNEDSQDGEKQARYSRVYGLLTQYSAALSFVSPEISAIPDEQLESFINDPAFSDYDVSLKNILAGKAHILSPEEEKILANVGAFSGQFQEVFNRLDSGDIKFDEITVRGEKVKLGHGAYSTLLQDKDQSVRKLAFETYYKAYINVINTLAGLYEGSVKADVFRAKTRKFQSTMESALFYEQVDKKVYDNLIKCMHESFQPLHHYIALRKKLLGLDEQHMYDIYVPLVEDAELKLSYEEACDMVVKGLSPLGEEYCSLLKKGFAEGWVDVCETTGKRSGAYSTGTYGLHPYVLLNYQQSTHDVFTIAHEMGHSLHTYYSNANQPYAKADYRIFVAEVASTVNEVLLQKYILSQTKDVNMKKYLLNYFLDTVRTTLHRQTMFAEFEYLAHTAVEKGTPLTTDYCNEMYLGLNKKYYGDSIVHDEEIAYEWSRIPHFYNSFYVYKYATGIISAISIVNRILTEGEAAVRDYKKFLSSGGSDSPVELLKLAGVDLTKRDAFRTAMQAFRTTLDELETLTK